MAGILMLSIMFHCSGLAQGAENKAEKTMQKDSGNNQAAQASGTTTGTLTINPKATFDSGDDKAESIKLGYVRIQKRIDPMDEATRKIPFTKKKREIRIVLSDQPIPDEAMEDAYGVAVLVQTGKLHAIDLSLSLDGKPAGGTVLYKMLSLGLSEDSYQFERKTFDSKTVAGKISMDVRKEAAGGQFDANNRWVEARGAPKYSLTAAFSAPLLPESKPTAQGAAAADSAPGKVVAEYMRAMHARDPAALKRICQDGEMQKIEGPEGKAYMQSISDWLKPGLQIVRVYEHPGWAKVDLELPNGSYTTSTRALRINGSWKIE
jgi:hypothetical protein